MVKIIGLCLLLERCSKSSTFKFITIGSATFKKGIPWCFELKGIGITLLVDFIKLYCSISQGEWFE